ncbi:MAG: hypothetical protein EZS28_037926 [Streblomastix strix]|uniref:Uncharacterized protein n=1 Tax=Streblomastix strix TaxID=222440 RepID=A0A5J4U7H5_9EUKA|nr:MAG: hypothetical protein EZS28_037926 [Streblomastix strix]
MRSYPDPHQIALTPIMHYLCDAFIRITFDENPDPQVLSMDVIGKIGGSSIRSGLMKQSMGMAPFHNIGQPIPFTTNIRALRGILCVVPENFGFMALLTIENKVYPDSVNVLGSE